jgi:hypothetical protein
MQVQKKTVIVTQSHLRNNNVQIQSSGPVPAPPNPAVIRYFSWKDVESQHLIKLPITENDTKNETTRMQAHTTKKSMIINYRNKTNVKDYLYM